MSMPLKRARILDTDKDDMEDRDNDTGQMSALLHRNIAYLGSTNETLVRTVTCVQDT